MALGLLVRDRVGVGQHLLASMLTSSAQMLCDDLTVYDGRPPTVVPDAELYGFGARYRLYEASDGWIYLAAPQAREWPRLVAAVAVEADLAADDRFADEAGRVANDGALADVLAAAIHTRPASFWEAHCRAHDVGCVEVAMRTPEAELLDDSFGRASGWVTDVEHPMLGEHPRLTPLVSLSRSGGVAGPGVLIGQQTDQVLAWLGYDAARIADLRERKVVG
jgi:crotonobetainyl-CoA:carnitine CoA-transferase CaiB-like acyl-CoA transferase